MTETKQNYLVLKVVKLDEKNELYKNVYRVTDETGNLNLLGYYDEKETEPVVILTNKSVLEYDWDGIAARVQKLNKSYCENFIKKDKVIVITDEAKTEEVGKNYIIKANIMFVTEHRYFSQFKPENTIVINPKPKVTPDAEKKSNIFVRIYRSIVPKKFTPVDPNEEYVKFVDNGNDITESQQHTLLSAFVFIAALVIGFFCINFYYENRYDSEKVTAEFMSKITQSTTKTVFDSTAVIDTIAIPDTIALNHDFKLDIKQQQIADSLAREKRYNDSVNMYLRLHRKVKVSLHSSINDGHTERTAKTEMVADSLREKDIRQLTTVINQMTKELNEERLAELKQSKFINTGKERSFSIDMSKEDN